MPRERQFSFPLFPKFLLPQAIFHRSTTTKTPSPPANDPNPRPPKYLSGHVSYLCCSRCGVHLCLISQIISKGFTGRHGRAYLVSPEPAGSAVSVSPSQSTSYSPTDSLPNTVIQTPIPRQLVTGAHTVSDISCAFCGSVLGWKYIAAEEEAQRYKVGKSILETKRVTASACWEGVQTEPGRSFAAGAAGKAPTRPPVSPVSPPPSLFLDKEEEEGYDDKGAEAGARAAVEDCIEFDSQDEDECEDLFAGIWSPGLAACRRSHKLGYRPGLWSWRK
ncbi:yippee family [Aspergillus sp. HF37]|nr:yippee family [Aspergillus sp. HF37]